MDLFRFVVRLVVDTFKECIRVIFVHMKPEAFLFSFVYVSKYCILFVWKASEVKFGEYVVYMNYVLLSTLVT